MEISKVVYVPEWEHIFLNVMYTTACPPVVCTDRDEQHFIELFLMAGGDVTGHVASPTKQAYVCYINKIKRPWPN